MYLTQKAVDTIVRSRIDCGAYFSRMDKEVQTVFGESELPEALHVVVSVYEKQVLEITGYLWDAERQDFVTIKVK